MKTCSHLHSRLTPLFFVLTLVLLPALVLADPRSTFTQRRDRAAIVTETTQMDRALARRDDAAYTMFLHPDFVGIYPQSKVIRGREEYAKSLHQLFALAKTLTSSTQVLTCRLGNGLAVVTTQETGAVSTVAAGKPVLIKRVDRVRSFWVRGARGKWLKKRERALSGTQTINGVKAPT